MESLSSADSFMLFILVVFALYLNMDITSFEKESHILPMFNLKLKDFIFKLR